MKNSLLLCAVLIFAACGKSTTTVQKVITPPAKALLIFPAQNAVCTTGTVISATQATVTFSWNTAANTNSYEIDIKNLLTGNVTAQTANTNQLPVTLSRNTPYSWTVISHSTDTKTTAQSDTWKFYVAGAGLTSYDPFPATIVSPAFGQSIASGNNTIDLQWSGSDVDNDIAGYTVYFGTTSNPPLLQNNVTDMFLKSVAISANTTYYWKIITTDQQGNTSDSGIFQFVTQ